MDRNIDGKKGILLELLFSTYGSLYNASGWVIAV